MGGAQQRAINLVPFPPTLRARQAAKLPMSIIIVGVGQAEFDGKAVLRGLRGGGC